MSKLLAENVILFVQGELLEDEQEETCSYFVNSIINNSDFPVDNSTRIRFTNQKNN